MRGCAILLVFLSLGCEKAEISQAEFLKDEVRSGEMGYLEAGCLEQGGDWISKREMCVDPFLVTKLDRESQQQELLFRIDKVLALLNAENARDQAVAESEKYLRDHPHMYRAALRAAVHEIRATRNFKVTKAEDEIIGRLLCVGCPAS